MVAIHLPQFDLIRGTLPEKERSFVQLDVNGYINQKMKKTGCLIAFFILLYSCSTKEQEYESFNVLYCKESFQGLHYNVSDKIITYKEKMYSVKMIGYYINRRLNNVDIYRSDGILSYTNNELKSDKHLTKYIDIPLNRRIIILQKSLSDNGTVFTYEQKGDSIFVNRGNEIIIYVKEIL